VLQSCVYFVLKWSDFYAVAMYVQVQCLSRNLVHVIFVSLVTRVDQSHQEDDQVEYCPSTRGSQGWHNSSHTALFAHLLFLVVLGLLDSIFAFDGELELSKHKIVSNHVFNMSQFIIYFFFTMNSLKSLSLSICMHFWFFIHIRFFISTY